MSDKTINRFNLRVYGVLINAQNQVLLAHERINDFKFAKFPGGGLEFGEGTFDCIKREFKEETGLNISVEKHLYTTDFFQQSVWLPTDQIISVYYQVTTLDDLSNFDLAERTLAYGKREEHIWFEWVDLVSLTPAMLTFPIDRKVAEMLHSTLDL